MKDWLKLLLFAVGGVALVGYLLVSMMYQPLVVWLAAFPVLAASLMLLNASAKGRTFGWGGLTGIAALPLLLSAGIAIRLGGVSSDQGSLLLSILIGGMAIMSALYFAMRLQTSWGALDQSRLPRPPQ